MRATFIREPLYIITQLVMILTRGGGTGEYIFDHRGGEVEGRTFRQWFIGEYLQRERL